MQPHELLVAATGNRFLLLERLGGRLTTRLEAARALGVDGVLVLEPSRVADVRMTLHNLDGSRAEMCGNGLRCIARAAIEGARARGPEVRIETDAGVRRALVVRGGTQVAPWIVRAEVGRPRIVTRGLRMGEHEVTVVDVGNPHCVLFVGDARTAPVAEIGPVLEHDPAFPGRTNVEFVEVAAEGLRVRIWERGVGETDSCGTGVTAAASVALEQGLVHAPVRVVTRGGELSVSLEASGTFWLEGEVAAPRHAERSAPTR